MTLFAQRFCRAFSFITIVFVLFNVRLAHAEQKQILDDYEVHYMVVNSTFFTPEVARNYGLVRSRYNALVNIAVLDKDSKKALDVALSGKATNLIGTAKELKFRKVKEGDSIYYLATLAVNDAETYRFVINIQSGNDSKQLKFQQKIYLD
ncbi:DUF4426 domain-containing protein [Alteromonas sp. ASW11-130]|uniref:DUF4426 domain-containing protein n=1 Tax=Alteromonas sp. ASW11-130 TaxID=3015775 RepID=UPI0022427D09|nr:DUF4426 domain-containing protein [Alteromonas sp. ASW11-130]MCW8091767.1 DUF4426 domain-containing protein [Alteromonas sp. ASW11-130]